MIDTHINYEPRTLPKDVIFHAGVAFAVSKRKYSNDED
jgi:hypothetical protein